MDPMHFHNPAPGAFSSSAPPAEPTKRQSGSPKSNRTDGYGSTNKTSALIQVKSATIKMRKKPDSTTWCLQEMHPASPGPGRLPGNRLGGEAGRHSE